MTIGGDLVSGDGKEVPVYNPATSSEFAELVGVCDRAIVLSEGRLVDDIGRDALTEDALLHSCYATKAPSPG